MRCFSFLAQNVRNAFLGSAIGISCLTSLSSAQSIDPNAAYGYKVQGQTAAGVVLAEANPNGARPGVFILIAPDVTGCMDAFPQSGVWADLCVVANQREGNRFRIPFIANPEKGPLIQKAPISNAAVDFPFELTVMLNSEENIISVSASDTGAPLAPVAFTNDRARFEAIRTMGADETEVVAVVRGDGFAVRLDLGAVQSAGQRRASINFYYNYEPGRDCLGILRQSGNSGGWRHLCEKADKDGLQELTGILQPVSGGAAHTGTITTKDGTDYQIVVSQARQGFAIVGLREMSEAEFVTPNVSENVIFDGIAPSPPPPPPPAASPETLTGYRVFGDSAMAITVSTAPPPQALPTTLEIISKSTRDCMQLAANTTALERVCEKMDKDGIQRMEFSGELQRSGTDGVLSGALRHADSGFQLDMTVRTQGSRIATMTVRGQGRAGTFMMVGEKAMYDRVAGSIAPPAPSPQPPAPPSGDGDQIVGYRLGAFTIAEVSLFPLDDGQRWNVSFKLDAKVDEYGYDRAASDCYPTLSTVNYIWGRQCEKATKDGVPFEVSGTLEPVTWRRDAFSGEVSSADGGWTWQMLVVNPTQRTFQVAVTDRRDRGFNEGYELLEFDTDARPLPSNPPLAGSVSGSWRLPQETLSDVGADLEMMVEPLGAGLTGEAVLWFRAETTEISGYCPNTRAMLQICERIQKDGPLRMQIELDEPVNGVSPAWRGTATSEGWGYGPFPVDFMQGSSIPDWGNEEPNSFYLRFRSSDVAPGSEAVSWLKVERIDREIVTMEELQARGTFDRPPVPPAPPKPAPSPNALAGTTCETLVEMMNAITQTTRYPAAVTALADAGFWGGILPNDPEGCERAAQVLSNAGLINADHWTRADDQGIAPPVSANAGWPAAGSVLFSKPIGSDGVRVELTRAADGQPIVRVPRFERCMSRTPICMAMQSNPGNLSVFHLASSDGNTLGMFNMGGALYLVRIEDHDNGNRSAHISEIVMKTGYGLGVLAEQ